MVSKTSKSSLYALTVKYDQRSRGLDDVFGRLPRSTLPVSRVMTVVVVAAMCIDAWRMCVRKVWGTSPWAEYALRCYRLSRAVWHCGGEKGVGVCTEGESGGRLVNRYKGGTYSSTAITAATLLYIYIYIATSDASTLSRPLLVTWWRYVHRCTLKSISGGHTPYDLEVLWIFWHSYIYYIMYEVAEWWREGVERMMERMGR